jgi:D-glycero-alpha-D-manno-heptose-7-phosphate kinase
MRALVDEGDSVLTGECDLHEFGRLLHESWQLKRGLSAKIAPAIIDQIYEKARRAGAIGGKLLGAGGGGFMLFFAPPERHAQVKAALEGLVHIPFGFETGGSQLIYYDAPAVQPIRSEPRAAPAAAVGYAHTH